MVIQKYSNYIFIITLRKIRFSPKSSEHFINHSFFLIDWSFACLNSLNLQNFTQKGVTNKLKYSKLNIYSSLDTCILKSYNKVNCYCCLYLLKLHGKLIF